MNPPPFRVSGTTRLARIACRGAGSRSHPGSSLSGRAAAHGREVQTLDGLFVRSAARRCTTRGKLPQFLVSIWSNGNNLSA